MGIDSNMSREETSWILYDVGNSAFVLVMVTALMPIFFKDVAAGGHSRLLSCHLPSSHFCCLQSWIILLK